MVQKVTDTFPKAQPKDKNRRFEFSCTSKEILKQREEAAQKRNFKLFLQLDKQLTRSRKDDKRNGIIESVSKDLDVKDRWLGIRELKRKYTPCQLLSKVGSQKKSKIFRL